mmetsp:Transcript_3612/g.8405  ORF Transcript_3612/g.8405 Transcript_3612/m.8405 type:complete len:92 (-) Transcript_3612:1252-1527(-)
MTKKVLPCRCFISCSRASWTMPSDSASKADVASSSRRMVGFARMARAIATRCFWPPLSWIPRSPTRVSYPFSHSEMKPWQFASFAASSSFV